MKLVLERDYWLDFKSGMNVHRLYIDILLCNMLYVKLT